MKESNFIRQNKEKWQRFEKALSKNKSSAEDLSEVFVEITDDLSYSRTFYPNRSVRVYLNALGQSIFGNVYKRQRLDLKNIVYFFSDELPKIMYSCRKEMFISLLVFVLAAVVGVASSINDPNFASSILSTSYTEMTDNNMAKDDPMAVYRTGTAFDSFWRIFKNNIRIDLAVYTLGVFFSIGTLVILLLNGVMVGAFQYYFVGTGFLLSSVLTIWLHGTIEISTIVLSGGAGLVTGRGLLFPGTYSRLEAFKHSATLGFKIFLGIIPFTLIAAIIEGYITRQTEASNAFKISFILLTFAIVIGYFVILPWIKGRSSTVDPRDLIKESKPKPVKITLLKIKSVGELFGESILSWKVQLSKNIGVIVFTSGAITTLLAILNSFFPEQFSFYNAGVFHLSESLDLSNWIKAAITWIVLCGLIIVLVRAFIGTHSKSKLEKFYSFKNILRIGSSSCVFILLCYGWPHWGFHLLSYCLLIVPFIMLFPLVSKHVSPEHQSKINVKFLLETYVTHALFFLLLFALSFAVVYLINSMLIDFLIESLVVFIPLTESGEIMVTQFVKLLLLYFTLFLSISIWMHAFFLHFYSLAEKNQAIALKSEIDEAFG